MKLLREIELKLTAVDDVVIACRIAGHVLATQLLGAKTGSIDLQNAPSQQIGFANRIHGNE